MKTPVDILVELLSNINELDLTKKGNQSIIEFAKKLEREAIVKAHTSATLEAGFEFSADDWANEYYTKNYEKL